MKKILTLTLLICGLYLMGWSQTGQIQIVSSGPSRVAVQINLGVSNTATPGPGADICNPTAGNIGTGDTIFSDITVTIYWHDAGPVTSVTVVDDVTPAVPFDFCTPSSNTVACGCVNFGAPCDAGPFPGPGYGMHATLDNFGNGAGFDYMTYGNIENLCDGVYFNGPEKWIVETWYTIFELEVLTSSPPGGDPEPLSAFLFIDDGASGISLQGPNLQLGYEGLPQASIPLTIGTPLPLDLLSFDAKKDGDKSSSLTWTTANEVNTKLFVIQRSRDRENWNDIGGVEAAVNNSGIKQYNFLDKNVYSGRSNREVYYYRLKMVDQDDSFKYSNIDVVSFSEFLDTRGGFKLYMYPNPATDGVNVEIAQPTDGEQITQLEMYDITGKMVFSRDILPGSEIEFIDFADLSMASGTYVLRAIDAANVAQAHEKIVVLR